MLNPQLDQLRDYPFRRLADLLADTAPPSGVTPINMSIGEPQHPVPALVGEVLAENNALWGKYPPTPGTPALQTAAADWLSRRYRLPDGMIDGPRHVLSVNGTREALFTIALAAVPRRRDGDRPVVLMPDPFYQIYAGAAAMAGAKPVFVPALAERNHLPDFRAVPEPLLQRTVLAYFCNPANPQGTVADRATLDALVGLARQYDFVLAADECYAEIYDTAPPPGILEACAGLDGDLTRVLAFHSLSKRSNVPGLRSGFVAGDPALIAAFGKLRAYTGGASPLPVLAVATALWRDEAHVDANRARYRAKFDCADRLLADLPGYYRPPAGFYLWLDVGDGEAATQRLWTEAGVKVLPGAYLSRSGAEAPGRRFIRVALVPDEAITEQALARMAPVLAAMTAPAE